MFKNPNNNNPVARFQFMQSLPPPPTPQAAQPIATPASPYQPAAGFQQSAMSYSFHRWLMLGVVLLLSSVVFVEVITMFGPPSTVDYNMEQENILEVIADDTEAHTDLTRVISSVASILQAFGLGLIGYALLRESHDGKNEHTALRVTAVIVGILVLTSIVSQQISLF
tara:strand:- start:444 stop:947 length:504 start_codon:yes stop_codon:yes gene_type:complete